MLERGRLSFLGSLGEQRRKRLNGIVFLPDLVTERIDPPGAHVVFHVRLDDALTADPIQQDGVLLWGQTSKGGELSQNDFVPRDVVHPIFTSF